MDLNTEKKYELVCFAPFEKTIASCSWNKTLKNWNTEYGSLIRSLQGHQLSIEFSMLFSVWQKKLLLFFLTKH